MARKTSYLLLMLIISGCGTSQINGPDKVIDVSRIIIDKTGKQAGGDVEMITRCSGFILSEKEVRNFLVHATHIRDNGPDKYYRILPCSSTGTVLSTNENTIGLYVPEGQSLFRARINHAVCGNNAVKGSGVC